VTEFTAKLKQKTTNWRALLFAVSLVVYFAVSKRCTARRVQKMPNIADAPQNTVAARGKPSIFFMVPARNTPNTNAKSAVKTASAITLAIFSFTDSVYAACIMPVWYIPRRENNSFSTGQWGRSTAGHGNQCSYGVGAVALGISVISDCVSTWPA